MVCGLWRGVIESGTRKRAGPCIRIPERIGERHVERLLIRDKTLVRPLLSIRRVHPRREHDPRISSSGIPYGAFTCMLKACFKEAVRSKKSAQENMKIRGHRE